MSRQVRQYLAARNYLQLQPKTGQNMRHRRITQMIDIQFA
jgi:hypothetical protein